jgi:PAS domain S-box-containing protein
MKKAPIPHDDAQRICELEHYKILDTAPERAFDEITELAAEICGAKTSLISFIDKNRQWFKSKHCFSAEQTSRDISYCGHAIQGSDVFEVSDSEQHPDFSDNPLFLNTPNVRFYAGAPLVTPRGYRIGTLCVLDDTAKTLSNAQKAMLKKLANQVVHLLEARNSKFELEESQKISSVGGWRFDITTQNLFWTKEQYRIFEIDETTPQDKLYDAYRSRIHPEDMALVDRCINDAVNGGQDYTVKHRLIFDHPDRVKYIEGIVKVIKDSSGKPVLLQGISRDISQTKLAEIRLESFLELSPDIFCILDESGKIEKVNPTLVEKLGYRSGELRGTSFLEIIFSEDAGDTSEILTAVSSNKISKSHESRVIAKNGEVLSISWSFAFDSLTNCLYASGLDISKRKSEELLQNIISSIRSEYIVFKDNPEKFFEFILSKILSITSSEYGFIGEVKINPSNNQRYLKTFSLTNISWNDETRNFYEKNAPIGLEFHNLKTLFGQVLRTGESLISNSPQSHPSAGGLPPGHPPLNAFLGIPIYQAGKFIGMAGLANRKDGYSQELLNYIEPLISVVGEVVNAYLLEKELKARELFNVFYKIALDEAAIVAFTDVKGTITYANELFCKISKFTSEELIGENHRILNSGIHPQEFFEALWKTIAGGEIWRGEICNKAKDGTLYWVDTVIVPYLNSFGKVEKYIAIRKDITKEKQKQKLLDDALERATLATAAKSSFLSTMSHEIRTPLNGIIGMASLLKETDTDALQNQYLRTLSTSCDTLLMIVNDILDFSKIEAGKLELETSGFNMNVFLNELVRPFIFSANKKGVEFFLKTEDLDHEVIGDSGRLGQILNNLISNAVKFTAKGSVSLVMNSKIENDIYKVTFEVRDTGIGIPQDSQDRMFEAFSQADSSIGRKFGGTGLGLSISKKLVDLMKGKISFQSAPGDTVFTVTIDFPKGAAVDLAATPRELYFDPEVSGSPGSIQSGAILIAEDNPTNQLLMKYYMEKLGYQYQIVANGNEVLDSLRDRHFDLILMDCQMPEMDGYEATRKIRDSKSLPANIPIYALTANALSGDQEACLNAGMNGYITKPVTLEIIAGTLKQFFLKHEGTAK